MSAINDLFGKVDAKKTDSSVAELFKAAPGPAIVNAAVKQRTVLPDLPAPEVSSEEEPEQPEEQPKEPEEQPKKKRKRDDDDEDLEEKYYAKLMKEDDEHDAEKPKPAAPAKVSEAKALDLKEDELEKAERTLFVGNVPADVITSKTVYKDFKKFFTTLPETEEDEAPKADLDSIRFRSISFDEPLPRKVAFVQQKLHKSRDSVNAYVVFKTKAHMKHFLSLNGTVFHDHHLRIDSVSHPAKHDNKRSIFVGNLDFEETEENLWKHFSKVGKIEYVRIVRDSATNVGKGFAYVQFDDSACVNKGLLLNDKKINGTGRKLRVTRCKNMKKAPQTIVVKGQLSESQKTKLGRAKKILGKADRATVGEKKEITIEGNRAKKGDKAVGLNKKPRTKKSKVTTRSKSFRQISKK